MGVDLVEPPEIPNGCRFIQRDILDVPLIQHWAGFYPQHEFDFIVASPPCEQFSITGMKNFHPNPPYPEFGIKLFNHTRSLCEASGLPYVIENVRSAEYFVGDAVRHCGPFYLWGNAVPLLINQGIKKGFQTGGSIIQKLKCIDRQALTDYRRQNDGSWSSSGSKKRKEWTAKMATIPPELANCVAEYAERLLEQDEYQKHLMGIGLEPRAVRKL